MNVKCLRSGHDFKKVYPDQDLIDSIRFVQEIEEIHVCSRCGKTKGVTGTVGWLKDEDR